MEYLIKDKSSYTKNTVRTLYPFRSVEEEN